MVLRILVLFFIVSAPSLLCAQSPEDNEATFQSAVDWLYSKLNYVYYDESGQKWWKNTFYSNDNKEVTIKHISSSKPNTADIKSKDYTIRRFKIQDINPNSLKVTSIEKSSGRLVRGKMLELRTFDFQDLIHKSINNRRGSSTSFLFLSFPKVLNDSSANYAELVKEKFEQAIIMSTKVYSSSDQQTNIDKVMEVLEGKFEGESGTSWQAIKNQENVLKLSRKNGEESYFGFDSTKNLFYSISIGSSGVQTTLFKLTDAPSITLLSTDGNHHIEVVTSNSFIIDGETFNRK